MNPSDPYQQPPQQQYPQQPGYGPPQGYGPPPGYPQQPPPKQGMSAGKIVAIVFGVLIVLALIGAAGKKDGGGASPTNGSAAAPAEKPASGATSAKKVALAELLSEYKDNELRADSSYKGQWIEVSGKVDDTKRDMLNNIFVTIGTGKQFEIPQVQCFFDDKQAGAVSSLTKGQTVTVRGKVDGLMMNVLIKKCEIVP